MDKTKNVDEFSLEKMEQLTEIHIDDMIKHIDYMG